MDSSASKIKVEEKIIYVRAPLIRYVLKVGTTTWMTQFLELSQQKDILLEEFGPNYSKMLHRTVPGLFKINSLDIDMNIKSLAEHSTSFSMVRHPFER